MFIDKFKYILCTVYSWFIGFLYEVLPIGVAEAEAPDCILSNLNFEDKPRIKIMTWDKEYELILDIFPKLNLDRVSPVPNLSVDTKYTYYEKWMILKTNSLNFRFNSEKRFYMYQDLKDENYHRNLYNYLIKKNDETGNYEFVSMENKFKETTLKNLEKYNKTVLIPKLNTWNKSLSLYNPEDNSFIRDIFWIKLESSSLTTEELNSKPLQEVTIDKTLSNNSGSDLTRTVVLSQDYYSKYKLYKEYYNKQLSDVALDYSEVPTNEIWKDFMSYNSKHLRIINEKLLDLKKKDLQTYIGAENSLTGREKLWLYTLIINDRDYTLFYKKDIDKIIPEHRLKVIVSNNNALIRKQPRRGIAVDFLRSNPDDILLYDKNTDYLGKLILEKHNINRISKIVDEAREIKIQEKRRQQLRAEN